MIWKGGGKTHWMGPDLLGVPPGSCGLHDQEPETLVLFALLGPSRVQEAVGCSFDMFWLYDLLIYVIWRVMSKEV